MILFTFSVLCCINYAFRTSNLICSETTVCRFLSLCILDLQMSLFCHRLLTQLYNLDLLLKIKKIGEIGGGSFSVRPGRHKSRPEP